MSVNAAYGTVYEPNVVCTWRPYDQIEGSGSDSKCSSGQDLALLFDLQVHGKIDHGLSDLLYAVRWLIVGTNVQVCSYTVRKARIPGRPWPCDEARTTRIVSSAPTPSGPFQRDHHHDHINPSSLPHAFVCMDATSSRPLAALALLTLATRQLRLPNIV